MYANLKLQLWKTGIRQNRLAQLLGMDETIVSRIVNGFREPDSVLRQKIACILQSDERWLFERLHGSSPAARHDSEEKREGSA